MHNSNSKIKKTTPPILLLNVVQVATENSFTTEDTSTTAAGPGNFEKALNFAKTGEEKAAELTGLPEWGVVAIFALIALLILGICGFCIRRFFKKRRTKDGKKGKGVDLKSVQLLGSAYKEKVSETKPTT